MNTIDAGASYKQLAAQANPAPYFTNIGGAIVKILNGRPHWAVCAEDDGRLQDLAADGPRNGQWLTNSITKSRD